LILKESTNLWGLGFILIVMGISIGWTFQPTQQALQGQSDIKDRSIIMGLRNALRYIGNAIGIAVSSLIFTSTITHHAESSDILNSQEKLFIVDNMSVKYDLHTLTPDPVKIKEIKHIYLLAIKNLIYLWIPLIGMCWILSFLIKDQGLRSKDEQIAQIEDTEMSGDVQLVSVSGKDTARI
jgi:hypothetical protein